jgi:hypothetical protein
MADANINPLKLGISPTVLICAAGGGMLGSILALWGVSDSIGIVAATSFVFAVMSGLFGCFL